MVLIKNITAVFLALKNQMVVKTIWMIIKYGKSNDRKLREANRLGATH